MEGSKTFTANKLVTTVGAVSFTEEEIVAQSDVNKIGFDVEMLVVEIDQQKYEEYLSSESGDLSETRRYRRVLCSNTRVTDKKESTNKRGFLETAAIEPLFGQEILAKDGLFTAGKSSRIGLTRTQLRNRNRRARRKALKARFECEANFTGCEVRIPRKLARINRKTSYGRVKCEVATCIDCKIEPACDFYARL